MRVVGILLLIVMYAPSPMAQDLPVFAASLDTELPEEDYEYIGCMCALWCAVGWSVDATSFLPDQAGNRYRVDMLNDGDINTAWVEGVEGRGVGERVSFIIEDYDSGAEGFDARDYPWRGIMLLNGYRKSEDTWKANGRVKSLLVNINAEDLCIIELEDSMLLQYVQVPETMVRHGDLITFEILDTYQGDIYEDTAITELILTGAH